VPGIGAALTRLARCCAPQPPAAITGFVTRGQGVTVHRQDCAQLRRLSAPQRARLLDVRWEDYTPASAPAKAARPPRRARR
jgi:GTP pyrophosphokinase